MIRQPVAVASPRAAALALLDAAFGADARSGHDPAAGAGPDPVGAGLFGFQRAAVDFAERILGQRRGVLIADGVGMGKTLVGAALAVAAARRPRRALLVVPAGLRRQWRGALRQQCAEADRVILVSHTALSRGADPEGNAGPFVRVIVDEAHAFRNPRTQRYAALARLTRAAEVVLLSATPVNNSLLDLYFLIRLFAGDGAFADLGVPDLGRLFRLAALAPDAPPSPALAMVLGTVMIRRTRAEAVGLAGRGLRFPRRAAPAAVRYDLTATGRDVFEEAVVTIEGLRLASYRLGAYGLPASRAGASELLRVLLAKRLESGLAAFRASIIDLAVQLVAFREALGRGLLRTPSDRPRRGAGVTGDQLLFEELLLARLPPGVDRGALLHDTDHDLTRLRSLTERIPPDADDAKVAALHRLLFDRLATAKVLVFTEFRDTAVHIWRSLRGRGGVAAIHGGRAFLGAAVAGRAEVVRRFAPRSNGAREPPAHQAVRVLIATDVLSEGLNLQDAAHVISYDLPWNPVRLIQRVGRIDRLGSLHEVVYAHHFLPDAGLERLLGLVERLRRKLAAIRAGLGATAAATDAADPDTRGIVERLAMGDPTLLDELETGDGAAFGAEDALLRLYREVRCGSESGCVAWPSEGGQAGGPANARPLVARVRLGEPAGGDSGPHPVAVAAVRMHARTFVLEIYEGGRAAPAGCGAATLLRRALDDSVSTSLLPAERRTALACARAATEVVRRLRPAGAAAAGPLSAAALRRLRAAAAALPDGPDAELCARIDRVIAGLARGLPAGGELALRELLELPRCDGPEDPGVLCDRLERILDLRLRDSAAGAERVAGAAAIAVVLAPGVVTPETASGS